MRIMLCVVVYQQKDFGPDPPLQQLDLKKKLILIITKSIGIEFFQISIPPSKLSLF
jgi:hypothetical protein